MELRCISILFAASLAGCVSSGTKIESSALDSLQPGVTTIGDVEARFGAPSGDTRLYDGSHILSYVYVHATATGSSNYSTAALTFDKDGKFVQYMSNNGQNNAAFVGSEPIPKN